MLQTTSNNTSLGFMNFDEPDMALKWAEIICNSEVAPKDFRGKPANVLVAMQSGMELGLKPLQSIQNGLVINGRYSVFGDAMLAICMQSPDFIDCIETFDEETQTAICIVKRKGREQIVSKFSTEDAIEAFLVTIKDKKPVGKEGPWRLYRKRMMKFRARSFGLRDMFPDVLKGIISVEEARDIKDVNESTVLPLKSNEVADRLKSKFKSDEKVPTFEIIDAETIDEIETENEVTTMERENDE